MTKHDFSGSWRSRYEYHSSSRGADFESEHLLELRQNGHKLVAESTPDSASHVTLKLTVDDNDKILVGSWREETEKEGYYKGAVYYGAIQMIASDGGEHIRGKWVGFGKDGEVNSGPWELTRAKNDIIGAN